MNDKQIVKFIQKGIRKELKINKRRVLGRPWSETPQLATKVYGLIRKYNYNNIMMHLSGYRLGNNQWDSGIVPDYSGTFNFSRYIEKQLIVNTAKFLNLKFRLLSGYFTAGGTESNIYSLWIARNWSISKRGNDDIIDWIIPESSHYSIAKSLNLLGIIDNKNHAVKYVTRRENYTIDTSDITKLLEDKRQKSEAPIIIVFTIVDTEFGLNDPMGEVIEFIKKKNYKNIFIHVDACFSGMILPVISEYRKIFAHKEISTIAVDFHKTFGAPTGSGIVLINDDYQKFAQIDASYLDHADLTLLGSRSGTNVIITWALFIRQIQSGVWAKGVENSIRKTSLLYEHLKLISYIKVLHPPFINYLVFKLNIPDNNRLAAVKLLLREYSVTSSSYRGEDIYKIIVTDYVTKKTLKKFIKKLEGLSI
ncbi:MAG: pyridoxal-dependent decarboxylase [Candidatus Saccharimonadaceae bacterium]